VPELSVETLLMVHFLVHHSKITDPTPSYFSQFEKMVLGSGPQGARSGPASRRRRR
jgi:hypothetical protein